MVQITQDCPVFPLPVPLSLVSRIWPCVAHSCWILSRRGTKTSWYLPEEWEERRFWKHRLNRRDRGRGSGRRKGVLPHPQEPRGQLAPKACGPKKGRSKSVSLVGLRGGLVLSRGREAGLGWPLLGQKAKAGRQKGHAGDDKGTGEEHECFSPSWPGLSAHAFCPLSEFFHLCASLALPVLLLAPPPWLAPRASFHSRLLLCPAHCLLQSAHLPCSCPLLT